MSTIRDAIGQVGVWTSVRQWPSDPGAAGDAAAELEELGYGAIWIGGSAGDLALHETLLAATSTLVVASGIVDIWTNDPSTVAASRQRVAERFADRFVLGLGMGHPEAVEPGTGQKYTRPLSKLNAYLDALDAATPPVPVDGRVLAALGPRALELSARRAAGAHPYLVTPEHTADARAVIGASALLAPEQKVFIGTDAEVARAVGRRSLAIYLGLSNYIRILRHYGFGDDDFANGGSDRFVDGLVAWGSPDAVAGRVRAHLDGGADHVAAQVLNATNPAALPFAEWREFAAAVVSRAT